MALKEEKVYVTSGKKKTSVRRETSAVSCVRVTNRAPKPTPKAAPPSEPSLTRGRSASRKRSVRGRSQTGRILRQPCRYYLKGTCTRSPCEYWHIKLNRDVKQGTSACSRTIRLKNNQIKSQKRAITLKRRESDDKNAVAIVTVPQGCVSQDSESFLSQRGNSPGETRCKNNWDRFEEYDSPSLRYVKQVSEKIKDHRLDKYKSKILIREVPTP